MGVTSLRGVSPEVVCITMDNPRIRIDPRIWILYENTDIHMAKKWITETRHDRQLSNSGVLTVTMTVVTVK